MSTLYTAIENSPSSNTLGSSSTLQGMRLLLDALPYYAFLKDRNSCYLGCNQAFAQLLGLANPEAILGKTDYDLNWQVPGDKADDFRLGDKATLAGEPLTDQQETLTLRDKPSRMVCVNKRPLYDTQGQLIGMLGVARDITAEQQLETALCNAQSAAKLSEQAKRAFLANIAHDLRTPLSGILGIIDLLRPPCVSMPCASMQRASNTEPVLWQYLQDACDQLLVRINQMITYAAQQSIPQGSATRGTAACDSTACKNTQPLAQPLTYTPSALLEEVDALLQPLACQKGLTLACHSDAACTQPVISDEHRFYPLLLSLVSNAIVFTEQGSVTVSMALLGSKDHPTCTHTLHLRVEDTGIGIDPCHQDSIFDPFTRLRPSYQHGTPGVGLGLTLAKQHLTMLEGKINVHSIPGQGSTFTCRIPLTVP